MRGQLEGIERMIEERRYCPDILAQTRAVAAGVRGLEAALLERHLRHCVHDTIMNRSPAEMETKISELLEIFSKRLPR